jgi:hypothetical protein
MTRDQIRYTLGEVEYLNYEAAQDGAHDEEFLTDEERAEWEEQEARECVASAG